MGSYTHNCDSDHRNEGWTFAGSGVDACWKALSSTDDTKYISCPSHKGRCTVKFPIDISSGNIPDGAVITSITIFIRVRKTVSDNKSVTVNILSRDDTSKYTSRTIYPTTSFADYEVGTYTTDPLGRAWTKHTLNKLMAQVFSYSVPPNDGVRVCRLYAVINYKQRPTVVVNTPTGTVDSASPTVSWTYSQADSDQQKRGEYKIYTAAQQQVAGFNPDTTTPTYSNSVTGDITSFTLPTSLTPDAYYIYVRVQSSFNAWSTWVGRSFTVQGAAPGVPGGGFGGVGAGGAGGFESVIADSFSGNAFLTMRDGSNMLSVQQADFETLTDSLGYVPTNCSIAQDTSAFYNIGSGSLKITRGGLASPMAATTAYTEIASGTPITARAQLLAATTGRTVNVFILFYDDAYNALGGTITGTGSDLTTTWTEIVATGTTPVHDGIMYAQVQIQVTSPGASEVHNADNVGLMYGANSVWSHGGHTSRNLLSSAASDADDPITVEPWASASSSSTYTRLTSTGTGAEGLKMFKATYVGLSPTLSFVSTGTAFSDTSTGTGYTLNKPASVVTNDLLVAYVMSDSGTAIAPTGWAVVNQLSQTGISGLGSSLTILARDALTADPSTWVGNMTGSGGRRRAVVVAYRGAAPVASQFNTENLQGSNSGSLNAQTPVLTNSDSNAWRLAAYAIRDDVSGGTMVANIQPTSVIPPISYVGKGGNWWYGGSQGTYQINKPTGVVSGDLMIAYGGFAGTATPTAATGWTQVRRTVKTVGNGDDHSGTTTFVVWKRTAGGSEASTWTAAYTGTGTPLMTQAVAYRNCDVDTNQFIAENGSSTSSTYQLDTATITNTNSKAWRVCAWAYTSPSGDKMSSNEVSERADNTTDVGNHPDMSIGVYDSNGPVSTGSHKRNGITDVSDPWSMVSWIGLLKPLPSAPSPGANETERADGTTGTSDGLGYMTLGLYDTNGVGPTGQSSVYGIFTPGSGTTINASVAWEGFLTPATPTVAGEVGANLVDYVDISSISSDVIDRAGGNMTYTASFLGSTGGVPYLKLYFYKGNELISTKVAQGSGFNTTTWTKSLATFSIPDGTTRIKCGVSATDRAINDYIAFDKVSVALGSGTIWRRGTGRSTHPVFNVPVIEFADDLGGGYSDWQTLPGSENALLQYDQLTGLTTYVDQTLIPHAYRKYRAKTISYGLNGDLFASSFGAESVEVTCNAQQWWLKDPTDASKSMAITVHTEPVSANTANTAAVFQPLGADRPLVLTEGFKGDSVSITIQVYSTQEYAQLRALLNSGKTLFLQSNLDNAWWVRPVGDLPAETKVTSKMFTNPLRFIKASFVEVDPE